MNRVSPPSNWRLPLPGPFADVAPAEAHELSRGAIFLYEVGPGIIYAQVVGHLDLAGAKHLESFYVSLIREGRRLSIFNDWGRMRSYDRSARTLLIRFSMDNAASIERVHLYVRSKLVAMGVATANFATQSLGVTLQSTTNRARFERAFLSAAGRGAA